MDTGDGSTNPGGRSTNFFSDEYKFINSPESL